MTELLKTFIVSTLVLGAAALGLSSCQSAKPHIDTDIPLEKRVSLEKKGWVDDDTYQVFSAGSPDRSSEDPAHLKKTSLQDAKKSAQLQLHHAWLNGIFLDDEKNAALNEEQKKIKREFEKLIAAGKIVMQNYDNAHYCFILYRIEKKELKKWAGLLPQRLQRAKNTVVADK